MQGWGDVGDAGDCCFLTDALAGWQCEPAVCFSTCISDTARDIPWPFWPLRLSLGCGSVLWAGDGMMVKQLEKI